MIRCLIDQKWFQTSPSIRRQKIIKNTLEHTAQGCFYSLKITQYNKSLSSLNRSFLRLIFRVAGGSLRITHLRNGLMHIKI